MKKSKNVSNDESQKKVSVNEFQLKVEEVQISKLGQCVEIVKVMIQDLRAGKTIDPEQVGEKLKDVYIELASELVELEDLVGFLLAENDEFYDQIYEAVDQLYMDHNLTFWP